MAENIAICVNAVAPNFIILAVGVLTQKLLSFTAEQIRKMNTAAYSILMSCAVYGSISEIDVRRDVDWKLLLFAAAGITVSHLAVTLFVERTERDRGRRSAEILTMSRGNYVMLGIPLVTGLYGAGGLSLAALMILIDTPVYTVLAIYTANHYGAKKTDARQMVLSILRDPLLIACLAGLICAVFRIKMPAVVKGTVSTLGAAATPVILLILGLDFILDGKALKDRALWLCACGKLIVLPAVMTAAAVIAGFRGLRLLIVTAVFACPSAVSNFSIIENSGGDELFTGRASMIITGISVVSMTLILFILRSLALI